MQPATGLSANATALYCARNLIECFFNKIKQFARIATVDETNLSQLGGSLLSSC